MNEITHELLEKYRNGQCSPEERKAVEDWFGRDENTLPEYPLPGFAVDDGLKDRVWSGLSAKIRRKPPGRQKAASGSYFRSIWGYAAAMVLLMAGVYWFYRPGDEAPEPVSYRTVKTPKGKKASFRLPDSTLVYLNSDSELKFPERFGDTARRVFLSGEAFLSVTKDIKRPFVLETAKTEVQVLGTRFNVKAYDNEIVTAVMVEEGRVRFSMTGRPEQDLILTAGQSGSFDERNGLFPNDVYIKSLAEWKENRLSFDNQELGEIAVLLERWYDIRVDIRSDALKNYRYSGTYANPALEDLIRNMCFVLKCNYRINNKNVVIYP